MEGEGEREGERKKIERRRESASAVGEFTNPCQGTQPSTKQPPQYLAYKLLFTNQCFIFSANNASDTAR
jgi:hypothetical protein